MTGSAGSGKTSWVIQQIGAAPRLLVWDSVGEWSSGGALTVARTLRELHALIIADLRAPGAFRVAYAGTVSAKHFDAFCRLAWVWLRAAPGVLVVEELSDVTSPAKAPAAWGAIIRKHRHAKGSAVYALTQRPAESDKTILGNAAVIHTGRMNFATDREYMARCLDVPVAEVAALPALAWIERDMRTLEVRRGAVSFRQN